MAVLKQKTGARRKQKNPRSKAAKLSHHRLLKVLECFAADLSIKQAHAKTDVSERALRDLYAQIRLRMVMAALSDPDIFNGFNVLITDQTGQLEPEVLAMMVAYTKTGKFKARMRRLYPRTNVATQPMLFFAIEFFIRRYLAMEPPRVTPAFKAGVAQSFAASGLLTRAFLDDPDAPERTGRLFWSMARGALNKRLGASVRRYDNSATVRLFRDLKSVLLKNPL